MPRVSPTVAGALGPFIEAVGEEDAAPALQGIPEGRLRFQRFAAGDGALAQRLGARLAHVDAAGLPHAGDLARLAAQAAIRGELLAPERVEPAYLRNQVALTLAEQQALRKDKGP